MKFKAVLNILVLATLITGGNFMNNAKASDWDKTFAKSDKVNIEKVKFKNRYGIELVGDLYMPKDKPAEKLPAIAVSGPFGAVKEQASVSFWPPFLILQCCHIDGRRPAVAFQQAPCCAGANRVPVRSGSRRGKPGAGLLMQFLAHCTFRHNPPRNRPSFEASLPRSVRAKRELR